MAIVGPAVGFAVVLIAVSTGGIIGRGMGVGMLAEVDVIAVATEAEVGVTASSVGVLVGVVTNTVAAVTTGPKLVEALKCFC